MKSGEKIFGMTGWYVSCRTYVIFFRVFQPASEGKGKVGSERETRAMDEGIPRLGVLVSTPATY